MTNLKVLSIAAALALTLPFALTSTSYAQDRGGFGARASGGGGGAAGISGGGMRGGGAMGGGAAISGGGGGFRGGMAAGGGGFRAGPPAGGAAFTGTGSGAAVVGDSGMRAQTYVGGGRTYASGSWNGGNWSGHHRHHRGGFWPGVGIGFGIGSSYAYYGGGYYDPYYYSDGYYDDSTVAVVPGGGDDAAYCAQRYRSYDPASGTYLGYDGLRHPCP